jgi:hypothetical protein
MAEPRWYYYEHMLIYVNNKIRWDAILESISGAVGSVG